MTFIFQFSITFHDLSNLSQNSLSPNVVAGYFHDHIFIRSDVAKKAVQAIKELQ